MPSYKGQLSDDDDLYSLVEYLKIGFGLLPQGDTVPALTGSR